MAEQTIWDKYAADAEAAFKSGNYPESEACWFTAMKIAEFFGEQDPRFSESMEKLAAVYAKMNRQKDADKLVSRAGRIKARTTGNNFPAPVPPQNANTFHK